MKLSATLLLVVSVAATALAVFTHISEIPTSCVASKVVQTRNFTTTTGEVIRIDTKTCSGGTGADSGHSKRQTINACVAETINFSCVAGAGAGPVAGDCDNLNTGIIEAFEAAGDPTLFTVNPQTVQTFTLGTCQFAWINENTAAILEFCFSEITAVMGPQLINGCIVPGDTAGVARPSGTGIPATTLDWVFEVLHS
ncbi:hypothetical protein FB45DRAFT_1143649 [Roridomyces roridus]|uniref:Uncharacterized protein n=1 Tax=Roridomyces roridus TaxID=1738132 RepID=A0AAD7FSV8_9AGAR|nr:hypothetical protein FB45DRAFT_1143649 [Roridomyces roridus]